MPKCEYNNSVCLIYTFRYVNKRDVYILFSDIKQVNGYMFVKIIRGFRSVSFIAHACIYAICFVYVYTITLCNTKRIQIFKFKKSQKITSTLILCDLFSHLSMYFSLSSTQLFARRNQVQTQPWTLEGEMLPALCLAAHSTLSHTCTHQTTHTGKMLRKRLIPTWSYRGLMLIFFLSLISTLRARVFPQINVISPNLSTHTHQTPICST